MQSLWLCTKVITLSGFYLMTFSIYCYHLMNVISLTLLQSDHINRLLINDILLLFSFGECSQSGYASKWLHYLASSVQTKWHLKNVIISISAMHIFAVSLDDLHFLRSEAADDTLEVCKGETVEMASTMFQQIIHRGRQVRTSRTEGRFCVTFFTEMSHHIWLAADKVVAKEASHSEL